MSRQVEVLKEEHAAQMVCLIYLPSFRLIRLNAWSGVDADTRGGIETNKQAAQAELLASKDAEIARLQQQIKDGTFTNLVIFITVLLVCSRSGLTTNLFLF